MSYELAAAAIAAIGTIGAAAVTVLAGRSRLNRIEVVSRVVKGLSPEDPVRLQLVEVLRYDAQELHRAQRSPAAFFVGGSTAVLTLAVVLTTYGEALLAWSPTGYLVLSYALAGLASALLVALVTMAILVIVRLFRSLASAWRKRREVGASSNIAGGPDSPADAET